MTKAIWNEYIIAQSDQTISVEGNQYFPPESVKIDYLTNSSTHTTCPWKGLASYKNILVNGKINKDAAWYYPEPKAEASNIKGYYAFWKGVEIEIS